MASGNEGAPTPAQADAQEIQAIQTDVQRKSETQVEQEIKQDATDEGLLRRTAELVSAVEGSVERTGRAPGEFEGNKTDRETAKGRAHEAKQKVWRIILAARQDKVATPDQETPEVREFAANVIKKISEKINPESMTDMTAGYFLQLFGRLIRGEIKDSGGLRFELQRLSRLNEVSPEVFNRLQQAFIEVAGGDERARRMMEVEKAPTTREEANVAHEVQEDRRYLTNYLDEPDRQFIARLYTIEDFEGVVQEFEADYDRDHQNERATADYEEQKQRWVSEELRSRLVLLVSKVYKKLDDQYPEKPFEEIEQSDFMRSLQQARYAIEHRIRLLAEKLANPAVSAFFRGKGEAFYKKVDQMFQYVENHTYWVNDKGETMEPGPDPNNPPPGFRKESSPVEMHNVLPVPKNQAASISHFLLGVLNAIEDEIAARKITHNVQTLWETVAPADKGFWGSLADYAQRFKAKGIDSIMILPDADLILEANRLYIKYLGADYARHNWVNQADQFTRETQSRLTRVQRMVLEDLKRLRPKLKDPEYEWRLQRALSMAVGISRGIFINEPEMVAWADAPVSHADAFPDYLSYYTTDSHPLLALNMQHHFSRWQTESVGMGPLIYAMVDGMEGPGWWNHMDMFKTLHKYRQAYITGNLKGLKGEKDKGKKLFIEAMLNFCKTGSIFTRGGFRTEWVYKGWWVQKKNPDGTLQEFGEYLEGLDWVETWKATEFIGYEQIRDLVEGSLFSQWFTKDLKAKELLFRDDLPDKVKEGMALFRHMYDSYINPVMPGGARKSAQRFEEYWDELGREAEGTVDKLIREGKIKKEDREMHVKFELEQNLTYRAMIRMLRQRTPTKFINIERNRTADGPHRAWDVIRRQGLGGDRAGWSTQHMDEVMHNLALVETKLRQKVSEAMREHLRQQMETTGTKRPGLNTFRPENYGLRYEVDEANIRAVMGEMDFEAGQIEDAVKCYSEIDKFLDKSYMDVFAKRVRIKDARMEFIERGVPFALATDEMDAQFLNFSNVGPQVLWRSLNEISEMEQKVMLPVMKYLEAMQKVSVDPERNLGPLVEALESIKHTLEQAHGHDIAHMQIDRLAGLTIAFFKKDTLARNIFTKWTRFGKKNSLAAEFAGTYSGVWEWDVSDIDNFIVELTRRHILPKDPYNLARPPKEVQRIMLGKKNPNSPLNQRLKKMFGTKLVHVPDFYYTGRCLRKRWGADKKHIALELLNKYLPLFIIFLIWSQIAKAAKDELGNKKH